MIATTLPGHVSFNQSKSFNALYQLFTPSDQDKRFTRILLIILTLYVVIAIVVPLLTQPEVQRAVKEQLPIHLAKIMIKEKKLPPPEKIKPEVIAEIVPEVPNDAKEKEPEEKKEKAEQPKNIPEPKRRELAKKKAQSSGLAAMKDELFAMRAVLVPQVSQNKRLNQDKTTEVKIKRKLLSATANQQVSSLQAETLSQSVVSDEISSHHTQQIRLSEEEVIATTDVLVNDAITAGAGGQRSEMSIRRTLEAHKSRLYARYNRALRKDPFLQGKILFEIEIQPSGEISRVEIKSTELNNRALERQLLVILRAIRFADENVDAMTTIWAIDFLPS